MIGLKNIGVVVLAAGASSRLGKPKQLLSYQDKSLLKLTFEAAKKIAYDKVVVILGGNYEQIETNIRHEGMKTVYNPLWEKGISTSICIGLKSLLEQDKNIDGLILAVCDQPFISAEIFEALITESARSGKSIVASAYAQTLGVPVLFSKYHFSELATLNGKEGAKGLLKKHAELVAFVPFEKGEIDIDTAEDYDKLIDDLGNKLDK